MPVMISVAPQFWHLRLSMIFSGLGINWGWGMGSSCFRRERYRALSHRRLAYGRAGDRAYSASIPRKSGQNGSLSKGATAKFKRDHWGTWGVEWGQTHPKGTDRKSCSDCMSLWVIRDLAGQGRCTYLSVVTPIADKRDISPFIRSPRRILSRKEMGFDEA